MQHCPEAILIPGGLGADNFLEPLLNPTLLTRLGIKGTVFGDRDRLKLRLSRLQYGAIALNLLCHRIIEGSDLCIGGDG